jgi:hypothetical protein
MLDASTFLYEAILPRVDETSQEEKGSRLLVLIEATFVISIAQHKT